MSEVYLDTLTLENFGPFYGEHIFNFSSLDGLSGILIGGRNGAGKTHLLRALYLAVVGESGVGDLKRVETGSDATRFAFDKSLNRRALAEGKDTVRLQVNIALRDERSGGSRKVHLMREIRHRTNSPPVWRSYAVRSDTASQIEDEQVIQKLRDAFLPRHLARFFFFDAERSQSINLSHQDIIEGITRILGLWTYGELETDLRQLIQQKIPRVFNLSGGQDQQTKLVDLTADVMRADGYLKARHKEQESLERELLEIEAELLEVEDDLKTLGAVDPEELQKAQERRNEITKIKAALESKLTDAWEEALPVALFGSYRKDLHEYLKSEERRREWESAKSTVEPKIPQIKKDVFDCIPEEYTLENSTRDFFMKRLDDALNRLFHPPPESIPDHVFVTERNDISAQIRQRLSKSVSSLQDLADMCINIERMDVELRELDQKLKQMQQNTAAFIRGTELHQKRGELIAKRDQISKRINELNSDIIRLDSELSELKRQETNQLEIVEKAQKGESLAALAARYRGAAGEVRSRAAIQMRKRISEHVGDLWIEITERQLEFAGMDFDSHWQCWLLRKDGKRVTWEETNTSAGQRQVRMLSFYEALRRLAKLVPPLVVDTPLARLDKEVRANVLDKLYLGGHQSIILSTNAEIDPEGPLFDRIRHQVARVYTLHPQGKPDGIGYEVRVASDYFGHDL
ncbi:MAG: AAA family ATPase [Deltaproteobacteria bacterium]|nr:AAA family ATPase [Deltaproteobacteria bacterium]